MFKRTKAAISGEKMLELYKNNKIDENFNNPQSLQNLLEYQTELIASGKSNDTHILTLCSDKLFEIEDHKAPDVKRLHRRIRIFAVAVSGAAVIAISTAGVCKALGIDFFANMFLRDGEITMLHAIADNPKPLVVSEGETYEIYDGSEDETATENDMISEYKDNTNVEVEDENTNQKAAAADEVIESYMPKWLPAGYELADSFVDETDSDIKTYRFNYENGDGIINVYATKCTDDFTFKANIDGENYEKYECAGVEHIIVSNNDYMHAYWQHGGTVFEISTSEDDAETLKRIIDSYYQEVQ